MVDAMVIRTAESGERSAFAPAAKVGGAGGTIFVASVIVQNVLRASAPQADATPAAVIEHYSAHHGTAIVLGALFVVGAIGIAVFTAGLVTTRSHAVRGPALAGTIGITGVVALFALTLATDLGLDAYIHGGGTDLEVVRALWLLHNAVFGILLVFIGVALAGLTAAASTDALIGRAWKPVGLVGGLALAATGAATPALVDGSPIIALGLVGFVTWLVFVATASVRLLRLDPVAP